MLLRLVLLLGLLCFSGCARTARIPLPHTVWVYWNLLDGSGERQFHETHGANDSQVHVLRRVTVSVAEWNAEVTEFQGCGAFDDQPSGFGIDWQTRQWGMIRLLGTGHVDMLEGPGEHTRQRFPMPFDNVPPLELYEDELGLTIIGRSDLGPWCVRTFVGIADGVIREITGARVECDRPFGDVESEPSELNPIRHDDHPVYFALRHECQDQLCVNMVSEQSVREAHLRVSWGHTIHFDGTSPAVEIFGWQSLWPLEPHVSQYRAPEGDTVRASTFHYDRNGDLATELNVTWSDSRIVSLETHWSNHRRRIVSVPVSQEPCPGTFGMDWYLAPTRRDRRIEPAASPARDSDD